MWEWDNLEHKLQLRFDKQMSALPIYTKNTPAIEHIQQCKSIWKYHSIPRKEWCHRWAHSFKGEDYRWYCGQELHKIVQWEMLISNFGKYTRHIKDPRATQIAKKLVHKCYNISTTSTLGEDGQRPEPEPIANEAIAEASLQHYPKSFTEIKYGERNVNCTPGHQLTDDRKAVHF